MPRGRVRTPESPPPRRVSVTTTGDGPPCPERGRAHGHTYYLNGRIWCPHSEHGNNGKFFSEEP